MAAERATPRVQPGDAAKLIRAIRFGSMRHAFPPQFYRNPASGGLARCVFEAVRAAASGLRDFIYSSSWRATAAHQPRCPFTRKIGKRSSALSSMPKSLLRPRIKTPVCLPFKRNFESAAAGGVSYFSRAQKAGGRLSRRSNCGPARHETTEINDRPPT